MSTDDWKLNSELFKVADREFGPFSIDMFASRANAQLPRYITKEIDAFSVDLTEEKVWANPPWRLIPSLLQHVKENNLVITVCVPIYTKASWYKTWKYMLQKEPMILPRTEKTFLRKGKMVIGKHPWQFTAVGVIGKEKKFVWDDVFLQDKQNAFDMLYENDFDKANKFRGDTIKESRGAIAMVHSLDIVAPIQINEKVEVFHNDEKWYPGIVTKVVENPKEDKIRYEVYFRDENKKAMIIAKNVRPAKQKRNNEIHEIEETFAKVLIDEEVDKLNLFKEEIKQIDEKEKIKIVREFHELTGYRNVKLKTTLRKVGRYNWHNLSKIVDQVSTECLACELDSSAHQGFYPLKSIRAEYVGDIWTIDLMFIENKPILHIVDNVSSFTMLRVLRDKEKKKTVTIKIYEIMMEHGLPRQIICDNGKEFEDMFKNAIQTIAGILKTGGVPYHPQTQGVNERKHGDIKRLVRHELTRFENAKWRDVIALVQMKLNLRHTARHNSQFLETKNEDSH